MSAADSTIKRVRMEPHLVELNARDLPAFCPNPAMPVWNHHPRVFLDVATTGEAMCPYCGTVYRLKAGEVVNRH
jgi:uncharacterized Zn-finger protein